MTFRKDLVLNSCCLSAVKYAHNLQVCYTHNLSPLKRSHGLMYILKTVQSGAAYSYLLLKNWVCFNKKGQNKMNTCVLILNEPVSDKNCPF